MKIALPFLSFSLTLLPVVHGAQGRTRTRERERTLGGKGRSKKTSKTVFPQIQYSKDVGELGNGEMTSYVKYVGDMPLELGIIFQESVLENLPQRPSDGQYDIEDCDPIPTWYCCGHEVVLDFPKVLKSLSLDHFNHVQANWNPIGHGPPGVYELPHFDMHFYTITEKERLSIKAPDQCYAVLEGYPFAGAIIPLTVEDYFRQMADLPCDQLPYGFGRVPAVEPAMGAHMIQPGAPEFNGATFDETFIYGTQDGAISFFEAMITKTFLQSVKESGNKFTNSISTTTDGTTPMKFPVAGYYPTTYSVSYMGDGFYTVGLEDFEWFEETNGVTEGCVQPYPPPPGQRD